MQNRAYLLFIKIKIKYHNFKNNIKINYTYYVKYFHTLYKK